MILYHGTTADVARLALTEGLRVRADTGIAGNWKDCPSHPCLIYLSAAYAPYFAFIAAGLSNSWGIVEVDTDLLDQDRLVPDEDWLEQTSRTYVPKGARGLSRCKTVVARTAWFRRNIGKFCHHWQDSVNGLGNAAHFGNVPAESIRRVAIYDPRSNPTITGAAFDPMISLMNYAFLGQKYRAISDWFFGAEIDIAAYDGVPSWRSDDQQAELARGLANRSGLVIEERKRAA